MSHFDYEKVKSEVLPKSVLEHFDQAREVFEKNKKILNDIGKPVVFATEGENALLKIIVELTKRNEHSLDVLFGDIELAYVANGVLKKEIKRIRNTLNQQGKEIDKDRDYDDVNRFLDFYINKNSDTDKEEKKEDD